MVRGMNYCLFCIENRCDHAVQALCKDSAVLLVYLPGWTATTASAASAVFETTLLECFKQPALVVLMHAF
jgi:hypothetical protein